MTEELYKKLQSAASNLCDYCENNDDCEKCQVTRLLDDATAEIEELRDDESDENYESASILTKIEMVRNHDTNLDKTKEFVDADCVLQNAFNEAETEVSGTAEELFELYENCSTSEKDVFERLFEMMLGKSFSEYLDDCLDEG